MTRPIPESAAYFAPLADALSSGRIGGEKEISDAIERMVITLGLDLEPAEQIDNPTQGDIETMAFLAKVRQDFVEYERRITDQVTITVTEKTDFTLEDYHGDAETMAFFRRAKEAFKKYDKSAEAESTRLNTMPHKKGNIMSNTLQQIQEQIEIAAAEDIKFTSGNNAAGARARKALGEVAKLVKLRRNEITAEKNARAAAKAA